MTALRVTPPPSARAIWLADSPSVQRLFSCSTRSSVQFSWFIVLLAPRSSLDIVSGSSERTSTATRGPDLVHKMRIARSIPTELGTSRVSRNGKTAAIWQIAGLACEFAGVLCLTLAASAADNPTTRRGLTHNGESRGEQSVSVAIANLQSGGCRIRPGRRAVPFRRGWRAISRFRCRYRGQRLRPRQPKARRRAHRTGRKALAHLESLSRA